MENRGVMDLVADNTASFVARELAAMGKCAEELNGNPGRVKGNSDFTNHQQGEQVIISPDDSISQAGSRNSRSSTASDRLKETANKAGLIAKMEALKKKRELQQKALLLKLDMEELALQTEIEMSRAKEQIYTEMEIAEIRQIENQYKSSNQGEAHSQMETAFDRVKDWNRAAETPINTIPNPSSSIKYENSGTTQKINDIGGNSAPRNQSGCNPYAQEFNSFSQHALHQIIAQMSASQRTQEQLTQLIVDQQQRNLLPQSTIPKFGGDPIEFRSFLKAFESRVGSRTHRLSEKLHYLEQYTTGGPNTLVRSCMHLDPDVGYFEAWRLLLEKYGNEYKIAIAYTDKIMSWPIIRPDDMDNLERFSIFLTGCKNAMEDLKSMREIEHPRNLQAIVKKLPYFLQDRWSRRAHDLMEKQGGYVQFKDLVEFINKEVKIATNPVFGRQAKREKEKPAFKSNFAVNIQEPLGEKNETAFSVPCMYCKGGHSLEFCRRLQNKAHSEKITFLKSKRMCFDCLVPGHRSSECKKKATCKACQRKHPTVLHNTSTRYDSKGTDPTTETQRVTSNLVTPTGTNVTNSSIGAGNAAVCMSIIPVIVRAKSSGKAIQTYAFLDNGSSATFCSEALMKQLGATGKKTRLLLSTMGAKEQPVDSYLVQGLEVCDLEGNNKVNLPVTYTQSNIPVTKGEVPTQSDIDQWPHLNEVKIQKIEADIGLLIGNNVPKLMEPWKVINSERDGPYAIKTLLGWAVNGPVRFADPVMSHNVNRTTVVKVDLEEQLRDYLNYDFNERSAGEKVGLSREDKKFIQMAEQSIKMDEGHYEIGLPIKNELNMPNNKPQAYQRIAQLKRKFEKSPEFFDDYKAFIGKLLDSEFAEMVKPEEINRTDGMLWYLPHHGVYHPQKPGKIRVVFDCAARYQGISLNDQLLQGPDLTNSLVGVLLRFRQEHVAVTGDIEAMFHQVKVPEEDRDLLRFLWWRDGDLKREPQEYRMAVHLFGATSSPSCANYALRSTANDNHMGVDNSIVQTIKRNFYVDDCLKSVATDEDAIAVVADVTKACAAGGFRVTKWNSNRRSVLQSIPVSERSKEIKKLNLDRDTLPIERVLGVQWVMETDCFGYKVAIKDKPITRRGILSVVSSIYDPLGFTAPLVLPAKNLLQELCRLNLGWDEEIPDVLKNRWITWKNDLPKLADLSVKRCIKPVNFGEVIHSQIHHFADASEVGYGSVAYLRSINREGAVHCSFLMGKARVTPLKQVTIPRLELNAAVISARVDTMLREELEIDLDPSVFWSDSTAVLGYINNNNARYHTFVANRISAIHDRSEPTQWRYVSTDHNPADDASRGQTVEEFLACKRWLNGPDFLWSSEDQWSQGEIPNITELNDPEVKKSIITNAIVANQDDARETVERLFNSASSWTTLKKSVAWLLRFKAVLMQLSKQRKKFTEESAEIEKDAKRLESLVEKKMLNERRMVKTAKHLKLEDIHEAERAILMFVQNEAFPNEVNSLRDTDVGKPLQLKRGSSIFRLDPKFEDGLIRVGGRLERARMPEEHKHPVILPKNVHVSNLIIRHIHESVGHSGRNHVLANLRERYWIINANSAVRRIINKCVTCRKLRGKVCEQKMANLPAERLIPDDPPFTRVGTDYFGPFEVKRGRGYEKRYGVIFTCLNTRAIHIEVAHSMNTDSCINALRRFIARRGQVKEIRSDNGTNFIGTERNLREAIKEWNQSKIHNAMILKNVDWSFNTPGASHHGGVWERQIRSVRNILNAMLRQQPLNDECLQTYLCEVEAIINNRPITTVSGEHDDFEPLTPNHLLLLKRKPSMPPGVFCKEDMYGRRRWKQVQYMADVFWRRWLKEYLPALQERQKWHTTRRNVKIGDIVLVVNNTTPRNTWLLGKIINVKPDIQATCPDYNGETPIDRAHISEGSWTGVHVGNPITCDGFVTGWRFFPTRAVEFIALVMRPYVAADNKYAVVGRTIIPAQQVLNQIREFTLQESDWIPVRSGDSIGLKYDVSPIPHSSSDTAFLFTSSISKHELLFGTIHTIDELFMETYSFQAVLKDSYLPCHIINWPLMKTTTDVESASRIWMDDWNKIKCPGTITGWRFIAGGPGDIIALVYRAVDADNNIYEVVGKTLIPSPAERDVVTEFKLSYSEQIDVVPGDKIGLTYTDSVLYVLTTTYSKVEPIYKFTDKPDDVEIGTEITFTSYHTRRFMFDAVLDVEKPNNVHRSTVIANDHKLQNNNIESTTSKSMGTCVIKCVENEQCKSVNYNQNHMTCELNDATKEEDNGNFVAEDGERYIETSRSITNVAGSCVLVDCGSGNVCVEVPGAVGQHLCLCSATAYLAVHCPSSECLEPLGMESGDIFDEQLSASSYWIGTDDHSPRRGRLNLAPSGIYSAAWSVGGGASDSIHSWIQIDLLVEHNITGIQTQGRMDDHFVEWVRTYTISYIKVHELGETYITDSYRNPKVFDGNWDKNTIRAHYFNPVVQAVAIRIHPKDWTNHISLRTEVLGCRTGKEWVRAFKGISMTGLSIYDAWNTGAGASSYRAHKFLISNTHYRNNAIINHWSSFGITKVKLTLFSHTNEELVSVTFNGIGTTSTSWFSRNKIESSPWDDIKTADCNVFSIPGEYTRRFYMSSSHNSCDMDSGWFTVEEGTQCSSWQGYSTNPRIIYSQAASRQSWFSGDIASARAMAIDVNIG